MYVMYSDIKTLYIVYKKKSVGKVVLYVYFQGLFQKLKVASGNNPLLLTVDLLLFIFEDKKGLLGEINKS